jgi:DNA-binding transcriptional ArsR family regulator
MPKTDLYDKLLSVFENPTKLSILMLLSDGGKLTVTQMSKVVGVSKPNLYHFVAQMVKDAILNRPETRVKKNYVEKYYSINKDTFQAIDPAEQGRRLNSAEPKRQREFLKAWLTSLSLYFRLRAEQIEHADPVKLQRVLEAIHSERVVLEHATLSEEAFDFFLREIKRTSKMVHEKWKHGADTSTGNTVIIVALPSLLKESITDEIS